MEWSDHGIVLSARPHGENAVIVALLTATRGRHVGLVRGGKGSQGRSVWQPGNLVEAAWRARLEEHLGHYTAEVLAAPSAVLLDDPLRLSALASACAVADAALPERSPHTAIFEGLKTLFELLPGEFWPFAYVQWEAALLAELGFGLDLKSCAATGQTERLAFVSPKSARAVSLEAGEPYRDKLFRLPAFMCPPGSSARPDEPADMAAAQAGLVITGYFLERYLFGLHHHAVPAARYLLLDRMTEAATISGMETPQ